ncbi:MAG: TatD family hydrolase [Coriobacteriales bacterium]|jgi:TatD DNase family protein|nr:TatD family hydrolase [Coriobacteriales bacterium]
MRESSFSEKQKDIIWDACIRNTKGEVIEAPQATFGIPVADTHCHLDMLHHPGLALARAASHNVNFIVSITDPTEDPLYTYNNLSQWQKTANDLLKEWHNETNDPHCEPGKKAPHVRLAVGCHPHNASKYTAEIERQLIICAQQPITAAIGEIGLDYHYDNSPRETQRKVFMRQLQIANKLMLPVVLHLREAHDDGLSILKEHGEHPAGILLHCYNLDYDTLQPFLDLGIHVAFGGPLTFKKADEVRDAAARCPVERMVTETDAPFMAPEPVRGVVCGPEHTVFTAAALAMARGLINKETQIRTANEVTTKHHGARQGGSLEAAMKQAARQEATEREAIAFLTEIYANALRFFDRNRE